MERTWRRSRRGETHGFGPYASFAWRSQPAPRMPLTYFSHLPFQLSLAWEPSWDYPNWLGFNWPCLRENRLTALRKLWIPWGEPNFTRNSIFILHSIGRSPVPLTGLRTLLEFQFNVPSSWKSYPVRDFLFLKEIGDDKPLRTDAFYWAFAWVERSRVAYLISNPIIRNPDASSWRNTAMHLKLCWIRIGNGEKLVKSEVFLAEWNGHNRNMGHWMSLKKAIQKRVVQKTDDGGS